jgi:hypothetical protein
MLKEQCPSRDEMRHGFREREVSSWLILELVVVCNSILFNDLWKLDFCYISHPKIDYLMARSPWSIDIKSPKRDTSDPPNLRRSLDENPYLEFVASTKAAVCQDVKSQSETYFCNAKSGMLCSLSKHIKNSTGCSYQGQVRSMIFDIYINVTVLAGVFVDSWHRNRRGWVLGGGWRWLVWLRVCA